MKLYLCKLKATIGKLFYVFSPSTTFLMLLSAFPLTNISCIHRGGVKKRRQIIQMTQVAITQRSWGAPAGYIRALPDEALKWRLNHMIYVPRFCLPAQSGGAVFTSALRFI